jgi:hypothetical protein
MTGPGGLSRCGRHRDDNVAEEIGLDMRKGALPERKREDIRRSVLAAVTTVQRPHGQVADKQKTQAGIRKIDAPEKPLEP